MRREAMAGILDDFIAHVTKLHADHARKLELTYMERENATLAEMQRMRTYYHRTAWLAACSLAATVVMAVTR